MESSRPFHLSTLEVFSQSSLFHAYIGEYTTTIPPGQTVGWFKDSVRDQIESIPSLESWSEHANDIEVQVYKLPETIRGNWQRTITKTLENISPLGDDASLDAYHSATLIAVLVPLLLRFHVFRKGTEFDYEYISSDWLTAFPVQTVDVIEQAARNCLKKIIPLYADAEIKVYEPPEALQISDTMTPTSVKELQETITDEYLPRCYKVFPNLQLKGIQHRRCLIVLASLKLDFALFENDSSSRTYVCSGSVTASRKDTVDIINQAARGYIASYLSQKYNPEMETELVGVEVFEPTDSYADKYNVILAGMQELKLDGDELTRQSGYTLLHLPQSPITNLKRSKLIVEFSVRRHRKLTFDYVLYEHKSQLYEYKTFDSVEATSKDTVKIIEELVCSRIDIPSSEGKVEVCVYEPKQAFQAAYNKGTRDLSTLELTDEHLCSKTATKLLSSHRLSDMSTGQALIIIFRTSLNTPKSADTSADVKSIPIMTTRQQIVNLIRQRLPPSPLNFREFTVDGNTFKLKYTERMATDDPDKPVFKAFIEPTSQVGGPDVVVVKFTRSYCEPAHSLLAQKSLAPRLRYCEKVDSIGMYAVVMDLVAGTVAQVPCEDERITSKLRTAIQTLHDASFVHGDLREPNILVTDDGDMNLIDFDWCGKEGEARYPSDINLGDGLPWDHRVACGGLIKKEHDEHMYSRFVGSNQRRP